MYYLNFNRYYPNFNVDWNPYFINNFDPYSGHYTRQRDLTGIWQSRNISYIPQCTSISFPEARVTPETLLLAVAGGIAGIAFYVWEKYFQEDVAKHGDAFYKCVKKLNLPYVDFDAIEACLKADPWKLSAEDALRVRNRFETLFNVEMAGIKTLGISPRIDGVWKTPWGLINLNSSNITEKMPFPYYDFEHQKNISGTRYDGSYNWAKGGKLRGVFISSDSSIYGYWMEETNPAETGHLNTGNFVMKFMWDDQNKPIFTGTFGYGKKYNEREWSGIKIMEY